MDNDRDLADPAMDSSGISLERKRRDDEAAWFNELYLLAPVGYFVVGFDGKILLANLVGAGMLWSALMKLEHPDSIAVVHAVALWVAGTASSAEFSICRTGVERIRAAFAARAAQLVESLR